jgi:hypothetical protein
VDNLFELGTERRDHLGLPLHPRFHVGASVRDEFQLVRRTLANR